MEERLVRLRPEVIRNTRHLIPLFELVYHDCIAIYAHQSDRAGPSDAQYILYHLSLARMPLYRFGPHLYWKNEKEHPQVVRILPAAKGVEPKGEREFSITYQWKPEEKIEQALHCFVHFTDAAGETKFRNDHRFAVPTTAWKPEEAFTDGPHTVEVPTGLTGLFDIRVGLLAVGRPIQIAAKDDGGRRYKIGKVRITPEGITLRKEELEVETRDTECFAKGWDDKLCLTDAFIKNTYEFLSPTNELAMMLPMTDHRFLNEDRSAELTIFGENEVCIVINAGPQEFQHQGTRLPPFGFVVKSPAFVAYHALNWGEIKYNQPTLITMRSLDGKPLDESNQVRLYRAYGEKRTLVPGMGKEVEVERERILTK